MKRSRVRPAEIAVPVSSMGDIAFLLIIFFMVCSNFVKESSVKLEPPLSSALEKLKESPVAVAISRDEEFFLNGVRVADAKELEMGVAALIKDRATVEGRTVMFKCDTHIDKAVFEPVIDAIARAGARVSAVGLEGNPPETAE
jgi:biopolymer transport protein ExbD